MELRSFLSTEKSKMCPTPNHYGTSENLPNPHPSGLIYASNKYTDAPRTEETNVCSGQQETIIHPTEVLRQSKTSFEIYHASNAVIFLKTLT